jgi:hypothetical protein
MSDPPRLFPGGPLALALLVLRAKLTRIVNGTAFNQPSVDTLEGLAA